MTWSLFFDHMVSFHHYIMMPRASFQWGQNLHRLTTQQYIYIYGNRMHFVLQWWLQVLTCIIIFQWQLKKVDNSK